MPTLRKSERLCSRKEIDVLYTCGHRMMVFPYSIRWMPVADESDALPAVRLLVVVPKRKLKHAFERNRVKRLTRECYRLHKDDLYQQLGDRKILLSLNYIDNKLPRYDMLYRRFDKIVEHLADEVKHLVV